MTDQETTAKHADDNILAVLDPEIQSLIKDAREAGFSFDEIICGLEVAVQKQKVAGAEAQQPT